MESEEWVPKEVHIHFQLAASRPEGPAAPSILSTTLRIKVPSILSNWMGWSYVMDSSGSQTAEGTRASAGGCFSSKISCTLLVVVSLMCTWQSSGSISPFSWLVMRCSAALTLPSVISLANVRAVCFSALGFLLAADGICFWVVWPSWRGWLMSLSAYSLNWRCSCAVWSFVLEVRCDFWRSKCGMIITAFKATASRADASP